MRDSCRRCDRGERRRVRIGARISGEVRRRFIRRDRPKLSRIRATGARLLDPMRNKLVLTGFMATGKSVVGHALAHRLKWPMIDTDHEIVSRAGKTVEEIFSAHGEPHFRQLERDLIAELCAWPTSAIIATGGGA